MHSKAEVKIEKERERKRKIVCFPLSDILNILYT